MEQAQPLTMDDVPQEAAVARERDPRESMLLMASMQLLNDDTASMTLRVRNLSAGGLMAECDRMLAKGERVAVDLRNIGTVEGVVAWAMPGRIGIMFDRAIDPRATRRPVGTGAGTSKMIVGFDGRRPGLRF